VHYTKKKNPFQISHIVQSFAGKWLKESSATGFMRELRAPNERIQDVWKTQLLCRDCAQLLSGLKHTSPRKYSIHTLKEKISL
jgi:hypothetical protein